MIYTVNYTVDTKYSGGFRECLEAEVLHVELFFVINNLDINYHIEQTY